MKEKLLSCVRLFATPWTAACWAFLFFPASQSLFKLMSVDLVMPFNHLILCHPLLLPPSVFPSIRVFSSESLFPIRWPKYWSFSFSISPSNEYSGLISLRIDWFGLFAVHGTLKSLLQHHSSNIVKEFCIHGHEILENSFLFCNVVVWFCYQGNAGPIKWVRNYFFCFLNEFVWFWTLNI